MSTRYGQVGSLKANFPRRLSSVDCCNKLFTVPEHSTHAASHLPPCAHSVHTSLTDHSSGVGLPNHHTYSTHQRHCTSRFVHVLRCDLSPPLQHPRCSQPSSHLHHTSEALYVVLSLSRYYFVISPLRSSIPPETAVAILHPSSRGL